MQNRFQAMPNLEAMSRGGLSRREVGVAMVVAGLGALTLAATTVVGA
jgi:hypothetical protein